MDEKLYSQKDMDTKIEATRSQTSMAAEARYKSNADETKSLITENQNLLKSQAELTKSNEEKDSKLYDLEQKPKILEEFIKQGGDEKFFDDIMTIHGEDFKAKDIKVEAVMEKLKKEKEHYFSEKVPTVEEINSAKALLEPVDQKNTDPNKKTTEDFIHKGNPY